MNNFHINIIGASGSGKTTLGKVIADNLKIDFFDSDYYFHEQTDPPFQRQRTPESRCTLITSDLLKSKSWVLSGNVSSWNPAPEISYSLIVFLSLPSELRIKRLLDREQSLYGDRIKIGGDMEEEHKSFMAWTEKYDNNPHEETNSYKSHELIFSQALCNTIKISEQISTEEQVKLIVSKLQ